MTEISSATTPPFQPRLHVAVVAALGVGDGEEEAFGPVEEAEAQHIGAQERADAVADAGHEAHAAARGDDRLGAGGGIAVDARYRVFELEHRMMEQRLGKPRDRAVAYNALVHDHIGETRPAATKEAQHVVGMPAGMAQRPPAETRQTREFVA